MCKAKVINLMESIVNFYFISDKLIVKKQLKKEFQRNRYEKCNGLLFILMMGIHDLHNKHQKE